MSYVALVASVVTTAVSTGISMYGQQQQATQAQRIASYNAKIQQQNADIQAKLATYQAQQNRQLALAQYQQGQNNAKTLENQAAAEEAQGREKARRMREQQDKLLATQRARYAASGVTNEGSPLAVLADTARLTELNIQDTAHEAELNRQQDLHKADLERFQSGFSLIDASLQQYQGAASEAGRRIAYRQADLTRLAGDAQAQAYRIESASTLVSGIGSMASQVSSYAYNSKLFSGGTPKPSATGKDWASSVGCMTGK